MEKFFFFIQVLIFLSYNIQVKAMFGRNIRSVSEGKFPYIGSLSHLPIDEENPENNHICTCTLVSPQDVIILASCFEDEDYNESVVILGSVQLSRGIRYDIKWWIGYNEWSNLNDRPLEFEENDIGNIRLSRSVPVGYFIAYLSPAPTSAIYGQHVRVSGWGKNKNSHMLPVMRTARLKVMQMDECMQRITELAGYAMYIDNRYICSVSNPPSVMHEGDAGAPVVHDNMVVAIHRGGMPFPDDLLNRNRINIHLTIGYYRHFIDEIIDPNYNWLT